MSTTGSPETRYWPQSRSSSSSVSSGPMVMGLEIIPVWVRLTTSTWYAWSSTDRLRCSTPIPPCRAMAMAMRASVTVSMAEVTRGTRSVIVRVSRVVVSTSVGNTSVSPGSRRTSS